MENTNTKIYVSAKTVDEQREKQREINHRMAEMARRSQEHKERRAKMTPAEVAAEAAALAEAERQRSIASHRQRCRDDIANNLGPRYSAERCRLDNFEVYHKN